MNEEDRVRCTICDADISCIVDAYTGPAPAEESMCRRCFLNFCVICERCDTTIWIQDSSYAPSGCAICATCYDETVSSCRGCGNACWVEELTDAYCESCSPEWQDVCVTTAELTETQAMIRRECARKTYKPRKKLCTGNMEDFRIPEILERIGKVRHPVYLYGITDMHETDLLLHPSVARQISLDELGQFTWRPANSVDKIGLSWALRSNDERLTCFISMVQSIQPEKG